MKMIDIMKKLGIKKAEWNEIERGFSISPEKYKKFDERTDRRYTKNFGVYKEYKFFNEANHDKLIANGWEPVCDTDYNPVRIKKEYYVNTKGEIFRLVKSMNCYKPVLSFEQMMIGDKIVDKKDYLG